jgi:hypothetical protein
MRLWPGVVAAALLLALGVAPARAGFGPKTDYPAGSSGVVVADLDGDADRDIAAADFSNDAVAVLLNNGDGTYAANVNYTTGDLPRSITAADLDGDLDQDLVTPNGAADTVSVLKNNGAGTFAVKTDYAVGDDPFSVVAMGLDGDSDQDLAVANVNADTVSILLNNGNGTFAAKIDYPVGAFAQSIAVADLDGDTDRDLALGNEGADTVSVLKNNGNGTYAARITYAAGDGPHGLAAADLDGDTDRDLAVANFNGDTVSVLPNNGDGTYAAPTAFAVGDGPSAVAAADLDGDGTQDLTLANALSDTVSVLLNDSLDGGGGGPGGGGPPSDGDADGVADPSDVCPSQPGPASNNGCPPPGGGGDPPPGGDPLPRPECTDPTTLLVTCANPSGPPGVCGPTGTIFPQCYHPVNLPTVCGPTGTILVACAGQGPYIVACGGFGTILPQCTLPPPRIPQVCGPQSGTILPACTGANNPVVLCGPSQTVLPQCRFDGKINATPLNPVDGNGEIDVKVDCPKVLATSSASGLRAAQSPPQSPSPHCVGTTTLETKRKAKVDTLKQIARDVAAGYRRNVQILARGYSVRVGGFEFQPLALITPAQVVAYGDLNAKAFVTRADRLILRYLGSSKIPPEISRYASSIHLRDLQARVGPPDYNGIGFESLIYLLTDDPGLGFFVTQLRLTVDEYREEVRKRRSPRGKRIGPAARSSARASSTRIVKRFEVRRGRHDVRIRFRLSRKAVKTLVRSAGSRARDLRVRVIVSFEADPMPVARFVDIPIRIQRRSAKRPRG